MRALWRKGAPSLPSPDHVSAQVLPASLGPARWENRLVASAGAGLAVAAAFAHFGISAEGLIAAGFAAVLVVLGTVDFERRVIPNRIVLPAAALVLVAQIANAPDRTAEWLLASAGTALFLFIPTLIRANAMGMGDVKLGLLLGAGLGKHVVAGLTFGFLAVWPLALFLVITRGKAGVRHTAIPLGPFLAVGAIAALLLV
jgi:leader peptidase (prepilin peptidase) / N-methyltransferase